MLYFTSDLHFNHDREFIYKPRGFSSIDDMNNKIIENWNNLITEEDDVYVLGDLCLGGPDSIEGNKYLIQQLKGKLHIVRGNHDTDNRIQMYCECFNVVEVTDATYLKYEGYHFFLTHYPCITSNLEKESLKQCTINLYGHTHQQTNFYQGIPFIYHVGVDSHNCTPVLINTIIKDMYEEVRRCKELL